jgi:predicted secreted protein
MSVIDQRNAVDPDQPEEPTNRPAPSDRIREWLRRPYARRIVILTAVITLLIVPVAFLVLHFMNLSGAPASPVMFEIERTMFVFTLVSAPLMAVTLAILLYSLFGWGRVKAKGSEPYAGKPGHPQQLHRQRAVDLHDEHPGLLPSGLGCH